MKEVETQIQKRWAENKTFEMDSVPVRMICFTMSNLIFLFIDLIDIHDNIAKMWLYFLNSLDHQKLSKYLISESENLFC